MQVTRLGARHKAETMTKQQDPWGRDIYWYGVLGAESDAGEGTDFYAINNGYASVTPLSVDMTAKDSLAAVGEWLKTMEINGAG